MILNSKIYNLCKIMTLRPHCGPFTALGFPFSPFAVHGLQVATCSILEKPDWESNKLYFQYNFFSLVGKMLNKFCDLAWTKHACLLMLKYLSFKEPSEWDEIIQRYGSEKGSSVYSLNMKLQGVMDFLVANNVQFTHENSE